MREPLIDRLWPEQVSNFDIALNLHVLSRQCTSLMYGSVREAVSQFAMLASVVDKVRTMETDRSDIKIPRLSEGWLGLVRPPGNSLDSLAPIHVHEVEVSGLVQGEWRAVVVDNEKIIVHRAREERNQ